LVPVLADLNNDGNLDVVVMTFYGGLAAVYLGDGKGDLTLAQQLEYYGNPYGPLSVGDVNGDGIPDILLPSDADVQIALGNGDGTFQILQTNLGVGPGWGQILLQNLHGQKPQGRRAGYGVAGQHRRDHGAHQHHKVTCSPQLAATGSGYPSLPEPRRAGLKLRAG
jgi:hypothetical protein